MYNCANIKQIDFSKLENLLDIGDYFFAECPKLKSLNIKYAFKIKIGKNYLQNSYNINELDIATLKYISYLNSL
jgi:hypothetical protein